MEKITEKCPFCLAAPFSEEQNGEKTLQLTMNAFVAFVECFYCHAKGPIVARRTNPDDFAEVAVKLWNKRD